eukprot:Rmarinus@m.25632
MSLKYEEKYSCRKKISSRFRKNRRQSDPKMSRSRMSTAKKTGVGWQPQRGKQRKGRGEGGWVLWTPMPIRRAGTLIRCFLAHGPSRPGPSGVETRVRLPHALSPVCFTASWKDFLKGSLTPKEMFTRF